MSNIIASNIKEFSLVSTRKGIDFHRRHATPVPVRKY